MILKAGTYRFNDVLVDFPPYNESLTGNLCEVPFVYDGANYGVMYAFSLTISTIMAETLHFFVDVNTETSVEIYTTQYNNGVATDASKGYVVSTPVEITITADTEVTDTFGTWYIANTNYEETYLATIEYNGQTIAELNAGETATLSCEGKKMVTDLSVKIESGYVKPSGSVTVTENGTVDVTDIEEVVVDVPIPDGYIQPSGSLEITENSTVDVTDKEEVVVNVEPKLTILAKAITVNTIDSDDDHEYYPPEGYDGFSKVMLSVNVPTYLTVSTEDEALDETTIPIVEGQIIIVEG